MANYREGHTTEKHGTFEWIVGWEELAAHLAPPDAAAGDREESARVTA